MPKPADQILGHRKRKPRVVSSSAAAAAAPDDEWTDATKTAWAAYWGSDVAKLALDIDIHAIRRLFGLYDQYERSMDIVRRALVVKGSTGQLRTNPLADHVLKLEGVILRLENELGLTPMARTRLGIRLVRPGGEQAEPPTSRYRHLKVV